MKTLLIGLFALAFAQPAAHPLQGRWIADLAASQLHPGTSVRSIALTFVVSSDRVRITDDVVSASGEQRSHGPGEFITDGQAHPNDALLPGLIARGRWASPRRLETMLTRRNGVVEHVSYELSPDGLTLTNTTEGPLGRQIVLFRREE